MRTNLFIRTKSFSCSRNGSTYQCSQLAQQRKGKATIASASGRNIKKKPLYASRRFFLIRRAQLQYVDSRLSGSLIGLQHKRKPIWMKLWSTRRILQWNSTALLPCQRAMNFYGPALAESTVIIQHVISMQTIPVLFTPRSCPVRHLACESVRDSSR